MNRQNAISARRIDVSGVVQGVGFRPFLFQLAHHYEFTGRVSNTGQGVSLVVEGRESRMTHFCRDITDKAPPLSAVVGVINTVIPVQGYSDFCIEKSQGRGGRSTLISPDVSICRDCLTEMMDPRDRRYGYPFINCTNCGPRYTIIKDVPYDRPRTAMASFAMCPTCQREYDDPLDRRFHAQPNACPACGPHVFLTDPRGKRVNTSPENALDQAAEMLKKGYIVAVKGLGGFHLAVDAACHDGVRRLRQVKKRPDKPFALMARSTDAAAAVVRMNAREKALLTSHRRPIVLLEKIKFPEVEAAAEQFRTGKRNCSCGPASSLSSAVAPGNPFLGVMLPYTPLHYLLLEKGPPMLVMTSGNPGGEPLSIDNDDALAAFSHMADYFLLHNRDIYFRADDSIMQVQAGRPRFLRRSRGFAPLPVFLEQNLPRVLACGGGLKSTICLTRENKAFLSQHIGDLDNEKVFRFYRRSVDHLQRILDVNPEIIAHDLHPGYMSSSWALGREGVTRVAVQHHHAHAAACMAENNLTGPVIAVTLDGTGLGSDGRIWGGEVLTCTFTDFQRHAHLKYVPMPGGDRAVHEPWRMAAAYLWQGWGEEFFKLDLPLVRRVGTGPLQFMGKMMTKKLNSPLTSSTGRLFDAVASLVGLRDRISFESQAAMDLQAVVTRDNAPPRYEMAFNDATTDDGYALMEMDVLPAIRRMVRDIQKDRSPGVISAGFHHMIINGFCRAVLMVREKTGINQVVLSGGVFNNKIILEGLLKQLEDSGLRVYTHEQVPTGDGGISLGQAVIAGMSARRHNEH